MGLAARATRLARSEGLAVHQVSDPPSLYARLGQLREQGVQQIWILSGDGTIQALAEYFNDEAPDWSPALLLLAGGRANIVPRDAGGYPAMRALRKALAALRAGRPLPEESIHMLRVAQAGQPARHGFLWGGGLVFEGVRLTAAHRAAGRGWWHRSWFADPYILIRWAIRTLVFRAPLRSVQVSGRAIGMGDVAGTMHLLLASTLALRNALYNPFAERGEGPVRFTAVRTGGPSLLRLLPALIRGRFDQDRDTRRGILSSRTDRVELRGIDRYALDGELFSVDPALPLVLTAGQALRVLRPAS
jgi:diacylglycerol kinase family enzyme